MRSGIVLAFLLIIVMLLAACGAAGEEAEATATVPLSSCAMFSSCSDIPPASATLLSPDIDDIDLPVPDPEALVQAHVVRIVSGDTLDVDVNGSEQTIHLAGIQAPEACYSSEATARAWAMLDLAGREVLLEGDGTGANQYVWVDYPEGIRLLNYELIRSGHARSSADAGEARYWDIFQGAEQKAESASEGLWGACSS